MTLRVKFVLLVVLPLTVIFSVLAFMQFRAMREAAMSTAEQHALLLTQATAREIEGELAKAVHVANAGAVALAEAHEIDGNRAWGLLEQLVEGVPLVEGASIAWSPEHHSASGPVAPYVWLRDESLQRRDLKKYYEEQGLTPYTDRDWYRVAAEGESGWTRPYDGPVFDGLLVSYSVPIIRQDVIVGVLSLDVPLVPLQQRLSISEFEQAQGYLVGPEDRFISNPDPSLIMQSVVETGAPSLLADTPPGSLLHVDDWPDGLPHIVAFEPIPTVDWVFAAAMSREDVIGPVRRQLTWNIGLLLAGGLVMSVIVLATGLRLTGDVRRLSAAVDRITAGDLSASVQGISRKDELGKLAVDFNKMTQQLVDTVERAADEQAARQAVEQELDTAAEIQRQMLPPSDGLLHEYPSVDLHAINVAARHVAGDFYDYWVREGVLTAVLADVAGSGMPAALVMVRAMTLLRQNDHSGLSLIELVKRTNKALCRSNERQLFVTGVIMRYVLETGELELVSAGHLPALMCINGTVAEEGPSTGLLLGVEPEASYSSRQSTLNPGDWIGVYTDGLTEARSSSGQMFGPERLVEGLQSHATQGAKALCSRGIDLAEEWHGGRINDDLSMLVIRRV